MKTHEGVFLVAVIACAAVFGMISISNSINIYKHSYGYSLGLERDDPNARNVPMEDLQKWIRLRRLSDHEAEFYRPVSSGNAPGHPTATPLSAPSSSCP